tara:strand:- start:33 stop:785 length:753 start_codon:yes stop_codon:yes gene_type:complete
MIPKKQHTWNDGAELVRHIRDLYCTHAVEGTAQQKYISDVLEIPMGEDLFAVSSMTSHNTLWSGGFDADDLEAELEEDIDPRQRKNGNKVKQYGQKLKVKKVVERSKKALGGYAICACSNCSFIEYRKNTPKELEDGCAVCGETIDRAYSDMQLLDEEFQDCTCSSCNNRFHRLEMVNEDQCKLCFLSEEDPRSISITNGGITPKDRKFFCKITKKEWPVSYSMLVEGELISIKGLEKMDYKQVRITEWE